MKWVLKWDVPVDGRNHVIGGGDVALVECQDHAYTVQVWTVEEYSEPRPSRAVTVVATGQPWGISAAHVGSCMHGPSGLVWHVLEVLLGGEL